MGQVGGDLESNMSVRTLDSLTVSIDTNAVLLSLIHIYRG